MTDVNIEHVRKHAAWTLDPQDPLGYQWRTPGTYITATAPDGSALALIRIGFVRRLDGSVIDEHAAQLLAQALRGLYESQ